MNRQVFWQRLAVISVLFSLLAVTLADDQVSISDLHEAVAHSQAEVGSMKELEKRLLAKGLTVRRGSSAHLHSMMVGGDKSERDEAALHAAHIVAASQQLKSKLNWNADEARSNLPLLSLKNTDLKNSCPESITCPPAKSIKYRPIDGSCNNPSHADWGKANTPFQRALPNAYADGIFQPRVAVNGSQLTSPRLVSSTFIVVPPSVTAANFTLALMSWGQFITHDLTLAAAFTSADGKSPVCCNATTGEHLDSQYLHPFCLPINIPDNDPFYSQYKIKCMSFVRTQIGADYSCSLGHAEQLNGNTHWLDGSVVYSSSASDLENLRLGQDGALKNSTSEDGKELLPLKSTCSDATCYYAGDVRAQENPQLAILQTMMMREHNRLAQALKELNPKWEDETIFQEARRIVIAELQHITYTEYLPAMLGTQAMGDYKLNPAQKGAFAQYDSKIASDPSIWNEFAAGAFRVGHSQVAGALILYDENDVQDQTFTLSNYFFDASQLPKPGFIDNAIRGLTKQPSWAVNPEYTSQLTTQLFRGSNPYGMDLVALNIQRGREHGIPSYNAVRQSCGLPKAATFEDLIQYMDLKSVDSLKAVYGSVDDIDLYIGCLAESSKPVNGSLLGPTTLCIIAKQFAVTKNNDRFFYDVGNQSNSFTLTQLDEIRKTSLARIFCDNNNGNVTTMQPKAFVTPLSTNNARQSCSSIPSLNLNAWKDPNAGNTGSQVQGSIRLLIVVVSLLLCVALI